MPYNLLTSKKSAVDSRWYEELSNICSGLPEIYIKLGPSAGRLKVLRDDFIASNYSGDPDLRPRNSDINLYIQTNNDLRDLKKTILQEEPNKTIATAYTNRINEIIGHHNILVSGANQDRANYRQLNKQLYGEPDSEIFAATCAWIRGLAIKNLEHGTDEQKIAASHTLEVVPAIEGKPTLIIPSEQAFIAVRNLHSEKEGYLDQILKFTEIPDVVDQSAGEPILEQVLKNLQSDYTINDADVFWGVSHASKAIYRPAKYSLTQQQFIGVVLHELGSHLLEFVNGCRQPLQLLASGLDNYDHINEGRAFLREQIVYESPELALNEPSWEHIITMHLAISLAYGLYDHKYSFSEVYDVIYRVGLLMESVRQPELSASESAHEQAWITTTRVLKGIPGETYMKDIVYLEGNVRCWQIAAKNPERILDGDLGKFDISRQDHLDVLKSFNIEIS